MDNQLSASFKRELLAYFRTKRFMIIALVIVGLSVFSPLLITGLGSLMDSMSDFYNELGMDVSGMTQVLSSASSTGVVASASEITGTGLIVLLLLLNRAAGGEQKKRAVIIPKSAGLRSLSYILPKFIIYPLSAFVLAIIAMFASWAVSTLLYDFNDVSFSGVLLSGILSGVCLMLYICFHLTLGTATGKAGMSAAVCIAASIILPNIFTLTDSDYLYNPFALELLASSAIFDHNLSLRSLPDIVITIVFALALMVISYFVALFAQNAKKIDNSGNEIDL
ncbi:MAG: hypothetical protein LBD23_13675 [Oscillospiraceae bacterium]|jgi:hypothetical protein|nr:hypothetical protein [Oscillospiraceae bacterium]